MSYWEIFALSPHVELKHLVKDMQCLSLAGSLKKEKTRSDKNLKASSEQRAVLQLSTSPAFFSYLHEKLGAFGHEQLEDEGRREAGKGAENHKQPPALKVQRAHREMGPGCWNHQPGQTCEHRLSFLMTVASETFR